MKNFYRWLKECVELRVKHSTYDYRNPILGTDSSSVRFHYYQLDQWL